MADVLKEFLVKIGYHVDAESQRKFFGHLTETAKRLGEVTSAIEIAAGAMTAAFIKMGESIESTYYTASRSGMSVSGLEAFRFAAGRLGVTAEEVNSSITALGQKLKDYPALRASIEAKIGTTGLNRTVDQMVTEDLPKYFREHSKTANELANSREYARFIGLSPNLMEAQLNAKVWDEAIAKAKELQKAGGRDPDDVEGWKKFNDQIAQLGVRFDAIKKALGTKLADTLVPILEDFGKWLDKNGGRVAEVIAKMATALGDIAINIAKAVLGFADWLEKSPGWTKAFEVLAGILLLSLVPGLTGMVTALKALTGIAMPIWLLRMLGLYGAAGTGAYWLGKEFAQAGTTQDPGNLGLGYGNTGPRFGVTDAAVSLWRGAKRMFGRGGASVSDAGFAGRGHGRQVGKWWTPERISHATERLVKEAGLSPAGAAGLVARWAGVEAARGPTSINPTSGAFGISQVLGGREIGIFGNTDFDAQITHAIRELTPGTPEARRANVDRAAAVLRAAKTPGEGAIGASMFERAEKYNPATGYDAYTNRTPAQFVFDQVYGKQKQPDSQATIDLKKFSGVPGVSAAPAKVTDLPLNLSDMSRTPGGDTTTQNSKTLTINQNVTNNVNGAKDPRAVGDEVASKMGRPIADVQRGFYDGPM